MIVLYLYDIYNYFWLGFNDIEDEEISFEELLEREKKLLAEEKNKVELTKNKKKKLKKKHKKVMWIWYYFINTGKTYW